MRFALKTLTVSDRLYNLFLLAYPAPFRREYGAQMAQVFRDECRDTLRQTGSAGLMGLWLGTLIDLVKTAFAEHIWEVFHMPIEKLRRGSGLAAILSGALWILLFQSDWNLVSGLFSGILFIVILVLFAYALAGLYQRLPMNTITRLSFLVAFAGIIWTAGGAVFVLVADSWWGLFITGFWVLAFGLVLVGIVTLAAGALSRWSFLPVLIGALLYGVILSGDDPRPVLQTLLGILFGLSWAVLGFILWTTQEDMPDRALPA